MILFQVRSRNIKLKISTTAKVIFRKRTLGWFLKINLLIGQTSGFGSSLLLEPLINLWDFHPHLLKRQWVIQCYTPVTAKVNWILDPFSFLPSAIPCCFEWNQALRESVYLCVCEREIQNERNYKWLKSEFEKVRTCDCISFGLW